MSDAFVVDSSVVIQRFIRDTNTAETRVLFAKLEVDTSVEIYVPEFCLVECINILWKRVRFDGMPVKVAQQHITDLRGLPLDVVDSEDHFARALDIGVAHHLAIYDSLYLAICEKLGLPLITVDSKQASIAQAIGITLKPITDFTPLP